MKQPLVSIVIANWNGGKVFHECLLSLSKINYQNFELIIVDNGSIDQSADYPSQFKFPKVTVIKNKENVGFAPANNQGYNASRGELILFLNNDTKVQKDFLTSMVHRILMDEQIGIMQPKIFMMDKPQYLDNAGSFFTNIGFLKHWGFGQKDRNEFDTEREVFAAKGACMLVRRTVIGKVGLFDPDFVSYFEESDLCWRVWLAGYKVIYYPDAAIYHKVGFTIQRLDVSNINFHYYKNRVSSLIKNLGFVKALYVIPTHVFISLGIALLFLFRGQPHNTSMIIKSLMWNLTHIRKTLQKRKKIQQERMVSDSKLFNTLSRPIDWKGFFNDFKRVEKDIKKATQ